MFPFGQRENGYFQDVWMDPADKEVNSAPHVVMEILIGKEDGINHKGSENMASIVCGGGLEDT